MCWSTKRKIDKKTQAWFPFFEQLYRQTITGGRDVLSHLDTADREIVTVLPFHDFRKPTCRRSVVVEGYPKWTLKQLGLPTRGYKNKQFPENARKLRTEIVDNFSQNGIPISDSDLTRAVEDTEGDAVDALTLLYAA